MNKVELSAEETKKEAILEKHLKKYYQHRGKILNNDDIMPVSRILPAMDEYASALKEEARRLEEENRELKKEIETLKNNL